MKYLLLTYLLEMPVVGLLLRKRNLNQLFLVVLCINAITNLPLNAFLLSGRVNNYYLFLLFAEVAVVIIETLLYQYVYQLKFSTSFIVSFCANCFSFLCGVIIL